ncbi:MAG: putative DNA binding domain-containing protein, partial [Victivallales bacterium]|nr:putative DNA binding domain-containing protein [Victivallales bacterium]
TCLEFKRCGGNPGADTFESYCAFLNRDGGDLFLGVADDGTVLGVPEQAADSTVRNLIKVMNDRNQLDPPFYILPEVFDYKGKKIVHLRVPRSSDMHRFKGICYDRVHEADVKVNTTEQLALMYMRKQNIYTEQKVYPYVTMTELKPELIQLARRLAASRNPEHPWQALTDEELLKSAGLIRHDYANGVSGVCAAGVLLLGRDDVIHDIFPAYKTDALLLRNNLEHYDDRLIVRTNLIEAYSQLIHFGEKWLPDKFFLENGISISLRGKILRETVGNLLIHREFTSSYTARLVIRRDMLLADNANRAYQHGTITPQNLLPLAKNPLIADFFKEIGRADELGSGVRNLFKYVSLYSGKPPVLLDEDVFTLTIPLDDDYSPEGTTRQLEVREEWCPSKTSLPLAVLEHLKRDGSLSRESLARLIPAATPQKVKTALTRLQREKIIRRVGSPHGGHWEVEDTH